MIGLDEWPFFQQLGFSSVKSKPNIHEMSFSMCIRNVSATLCTMARVYCTNRKRRLVAHSCSSNVCFTYVWRWVKDASPFSEGNIVVEPWICIWQQEQGKSSHFVDVIGLTYDQDPSKKLGYKGPSKFIFKRYRCMRKITNNLFLFFIWDR